MNHDPAFLWCLGISAVCHVSVIVLQTLVIRPGSLPPIRKALEVVYEHPGAERSVQGYETLADLRALATTPPTVTMSTHHIQVGGGVGGSDAPMAPGELRSGLSSLLATASFEHASIVDLSNLVEASRGDPVLLSYFSAIREQIQRAANQRTWISSEASEGMVYVAFLLSPNGQIASSRVVEDRSVSSSLLQDIAVKIVAAASPFPPLPPSLREAAKTIVVPLEFLRGS